MDAKKLSSDALNALFCLTHVDQNENRQGFRAPGVRVKRQPSPLAPQPLQDPCVSNWRSQLRTGTLDKSRHKSLLRSHRRTWPWMSSLFTESDLVEVMKHLTCRRLTTEQSSPSHPFAARASARFYKNRCKDQESWFVKNKADLQASFLRLRRRHTDARR
ncbi:hypothetical protein CHU98_g5937 [Xylaria longipes]|nr:hypothetical protein CHU98_g5937 [Xylaria longipes]